MLQRYQIRAKKDYDVDQYLDGPGPLDIAPEYLRLYYWVLRCIQLPTAEEWLKNESLIETRAEIVSFSKIHVAVCLYERHAYVYAYWFVYILILMPFKRRNPT